MNNKILHAVIIATITNFATTTALQAGDLSNIVPRVLALESANPQAADNDFSGYSMPFSLSGDPRNVIVLRRVDTDGSVSYSVFVRHSSGETISVNGTPILRTHIAHYGSATTSSVGSTVALSANDYIDSPETTSYINYLAESSSILIDSNNEKIVNNDDQRYIEQVTQGTNGLLVRQTRIETNGIFQSDANYSSQYLGKLPSITIGDLTYSDVVVEKRLDSSFSRFRARGIGEISRVRIGQQPLSAIYYRVNGQTGGSLFGTPFQPGVGNLDGLFFTP